MTTTMDSVTETIRRAVGTETDPDTLARIAWATMASPGDEIVGALVAELGAAPALEAVFGNSRQAVVDLVARRARKQVRGIDVGRVARALSAGEEQALTVLTPLDRLWPKRLDALGAAAPLAVWVRGSIDTLVRPAVAVVGGSPVSPDGLYLTLDIASGLAERGWVVANSAGRGVDTVALLAALAIERTPLAVIGTNHTGAALRASSLLGRVAAAGAVLSEIPPGTLQPVTSGARPCLLLAAVTDRTLVVEASAGSSAVTTARFARDLGHPVGAVPAPNATRASDGGAVLLEREGATPVTGVDWIGQ